MVRRSTVHVLLASAALRVALVVSVPAGEAASPTPRLVAIRASHHPGFDRVVFQFAGPVPSRRHVRYVNELIRDGSGRRIPIAGRAILSVSLNPAEAHDSAGHPTSPGRIGSRCQT